MYATLILNSLISPVPVPNGKQYKMIAPMEDIHEAQQFAKKCFKDDLIPVFQASEVEVTRNNDSEMIVYCESLKRIEDTTNRADLKDLGIQESSVCIVKLSSTDEEFASTDLVEDVI